MTSPRRPAAAEPSDSHEPHVTRRVFLKLSAVSVAGAAAEVAHEATAQQAIAQQAIAQQASPMPMGSPEASPAAGQAAPPTAVKFFNIDEAARVEALTARILPGTPADPGAREAGVVYFIDGQLAGANQGYTLKTYTQGPFLAVNEVQAPVEATSQPDIYRTIQVPEDLVSRYGYQSVLTPQDLYRRGLASVEAYAQSKFGNSFVKLSEEQQDAIITDMVDGKATGFDAPTGPAFFTTLRNDTIAGMFSDPIYGGNRNMVGWKLIGYPGARGFYTAQDMANTSFSAAPQSLAQMNMSGH